jgi:hypothetical protein
MCFALQKFLENKFPHNKRKRVPWLAEKLGVSYPSAYRYIYQCRLPDQKHIIAIYILTRGAVQPNDFYDLPDLTCRNGCGLSQPDMFLPSAAGNGAMMEAAE